MSFAEKGAVGDIEPAFFIGYLHRLKATGTLKFDDAPIQRAVYFRDGRVLFCSSNGPDDQLGAILIAGGKISQEQFNAIVAGLEPKQSIAAALAQGGHVSQRDIGDAARRKVEQIIASCCAQTNGSYEFEDGVLPKGALDLKLTTEKVLISAFEQLEPSGFLSRILKSPLAVLAAGETEPSDPDLARVRAALDGVSSLADIGGSVGLPLAAMEARAAVLVIMGAANVVTSQIEEMALPELHEGGEVNPALMPALTEEEPLEAETIAFVAAPTHDQTIASGEVPVDSGLGEGESTLILDPADNPFAGSSDSTLVMSNSGLDGSESGTYRITGTPKREKASTQDLDAIKELIGSTTPPPGASSLPSERWDPVLSSDGRPGKKRSGALAFFQSPAFVRSVLAAVLLAMAGLAWMYYTDRQAGLRTVAVTTATPASVPAAAASPVAGLPTPPPGATPAPIGAATATPATTTQPVAAASVVATPVMKPTPPPKPVTTQATSSSPMPLPNASVKPALPAPVTAGSGANGSGAKGSGAKESGYDALKAGNFADAATAFETQAKTHASEFSIQVLVACSPQTIEKALQNDPSRDLYILPATIGGKSCYRLMRGFFKTQAEGTSSVSSLPAYYVTEGAKPKSVPVKPLLR
ncbi:MAG: DUF4388 domain-containing protein [Vicinamibacteria bacterium]